MRTRVRPIRPLITAVTATALSAALLAGALPAHAAADVGPVPTAAPVETTAQDAGGDATPVAGPVPTADPTPAAGPTGSADPVAVSLEPVAAEPAWEAPAAEPPAAEGSVSEGPVSEDEETEPISPTLIAPREGDSAIEGTVTFTGTGQPGAELAVVAYPEGDREFPGDTAPFHLYETVIGADGLWTMTEAVPVGYWVAFVKQSVGTSVQTPEHDTAFTVYPAAPRITAPQPSAHVDGPLRLSGTGLAGSQVVVTVAGGAQPVTVRAYVRPDGTWDAAKSMPTGSYTASAITSQFLPWEREARWIVSGASAPVSFTLTGLAGAMPAAAVTPAGGAGRPTGHPTAHVSTHSRSLPVTGSDPVPLIALMSSLLAAGVALVAVPRLRRRSVRTASIGE
jgi:hypothetical protein